LTQDPRVTCLGADDEEVRVFTIIGCYKVITGSDTKLSGRSTDQSKIEMESSACQERIHVEGRTHWSTLDIAIVIGLPIMHGVQTLSKF
jgi:hypothetical protein